MIPPVRWRRKRRRVISDMTTESQPNKESHLRSVLKALSWRIIATATTAVIAYLITGQVSVALLIGGIEFFSKFLLYYFHERLWQGIPRGVVRKIISSK
jgi:uncharacterized membrane protein